MRSFGLDRVGQLGSLDALIQHAPAMGSTEAERLTRAAYQTEMGICDHESPNKHPMALVMLHAKENAMEGGPLRSMQRRYVHMRVWDTWHISIKEFMETPYPDAMFYLEFCESVNREALTTTNRQIHDLSKIQPPKK